MSINKSKIILLNKYNIILKVIQNRTACICDVVARVLIVSYALTNTEIMTWRFFPNNSVAVYACIERDEHVLDYKGESVFLATIADAAENTESSGYPVTKPFTQNYALTRSKLLIESNRTLFVKYPLGIVES